MGECPTEQFPYPSDCEIIEGLKKMAQRKAVQNLDERLLARAKQIRLLLLDVDGVLTDGTLILSSSGSRC